MISNKFKIKNLNIPILKIFPRTNQTAWLTPTHTNREPKSKISKVAASETPTGLTFQEFADTAFIRAESVLRIRFVPLYFIYAIDVNPTNEDTAKIKQKKTGKEKIHLNVRRVYLYVHFI